ncbi:MAG: hypothetical protein NT118_01875 [Lentisphaerae bacterium]|nr:hypothetical protein [Lentisphaerota bacterium]
MDIVKETVVLKTMIDLFNDGVIPVEIKEKTILVKSIVFFQGRAPNLVAQIIAAARIDNFNDDEPAWAKWVTDSFEYSKEHRCHLNLIGKMLIGMKEKYPECYDRLITLEFDSNLSIASLYRQKGAHDVQRFLAAYVENMSRDEVRDAVELCLDPHSQKKPSTPSTAIQPELPGLWKNISAMSENFKHLDHVKIIEGYTPDTAQQTIEVAINCMTIVSEYYKRSGEFKNLTVLELNKLEAFSNKIYRQFSAWREELCATDFKPAG